MGDECDIPTCEELSIEPFGDKLYGQNTFRAIHNEIERVEEYIKPILPNFEFIAQDEIEFGQIALCEYPHHDTPEGVYIYFLSSENYPGIITYNQNSRKRSADLIHGVIDLGGTYEGVDIPRFHHVINICFDGIRRSISEPFAYLIEALEEEEFAKDKGVGRKANANKMREIESRKLVEELGFDYVGSTTAQRILQLVKAVREELDRVI